MTWQISEPFIGYQQITETSTTQKHPLGTRVQAIDGTNGVGEFIYLKGVASTAIGTWSHFYADNWATVRAVANGVGPLGIAMSANVANQYGWYQIYGKASGLCLANFADDGDVYLTATDGSVDDADVAGDYVRGARGASARDATTGLADFELYYPHTEDGKDN